MNRKKNPVLFWVLTGLIVALIIVFVAQNHQNVRIQFLTINVAGPGFLVFLVVFFLGFLGGWGWERSRRPSRRQSSESQKRINRQ